MPTETAIKTFFEDELGIDADDIESDTLLFSEGVIDSFALVTLMMFLERECSVRIGPADVNLDNFDSIDRMLAYLSRAKA